jgi:SAM-dependent methyltransferase
MIYEKGFFLTSTDISEERVSLARVNNQNSNIMFKVGDATKLQFPLESFDVVYSHHMIEHLHPDDVLDHFQEVQKILKKGGFYYFTMPNRLWGPKDVSQVFGCKKTYGMHLKEYSYSEIYTILKKSGFDNLKSPMIHPIIFHKFGLCPPLINSNKKNLCESSFRLVPGPLNKFISGFIVINSIMIIVVK